MTIPPAQCERLIPEQLTDPTPGASIPNFTRADQLRAEGDDLASAREEAKIWQIFGLQQSGQLEIANNDKPAIRHIIKECETLVNGSRPRNKVLGIF